MRSQKSMRKNLILAISVSSGLFSIFIFSFYLAGVFLEIAASDIQEVLGVTLLTLKAGEILLVQLQIALWLGLLIFMPIIAFFITRYFWDALYETERRWALALIIPFLCVIIGSFTGYFASLYLLMPYLFGYNAGLEVETTLTVANMVFFLFQSALMFSFVVSIPFVVQFLIRSGLVSKSFLRENWRVPVAIFVVLSMVITPPDPVSMLVTALPMSLLYGLSIL